jgi:hypothetical protein
MACEVRDHQLKVILQLGRYIVPSSRLIACAMRQHQHRARAAMPHDLFSHRGRESCFPKTGSAKRASPKPESHGDGS